MLYILPTILSLIIILLSGMIVHLYREASPKIQFVPNDGNTPSRLIIPPELMHQMPQEYIFVTDDTARWCNEQLQILRSKHPMVVEARDNLQMIWLLAREL